MISKVRLLLVIPLCAVILAVGCNKDKRASASIKGKVMYKDAPVTGGMMTLYSSDQGAYPVPIKEDGTFEQTGLPPGEMTVCVETETLNPNKAKGGLAAKYNKAGNSTPESQKENAKTPGTYVKIPRKYAGATESPEKITLKPGENIKDIILQGEP